MTGKIFAAEINFQDTPLPIRGKFTDSEKDITRLLETFRRRVKEVFIFANKQRLTVYIAHEDMRPLVDFFHREHDLNGFIQFYYNTAESMTHIMATASGLLSPLKGEAQVLSDMAKCFDRACASGCIGMTLDDAVRKAIATGKRVRTETGIDQYCASIAETGIELLFNRLQDIHQLNFVVVGTGETARVALAALTGEGISNIVLTGQDAEAVCRLAGRYGVESIDFSALPECFAEADVVIGAAYGELEIQLLPALKDAGLRERTDRIILDLGIPSNFSPDTVEMLADEIYNLDDLRHLHPSPLEIFGGVEAAWQMVLRAAGEFSFLTQLLRQSPVLNGYLARQFAAKNEAGKIRTKTKRSFRAMFFRRNEHEPGLFSKKRNQAPDNHLPVNAAEVVRNVWEIKRFRYWISEN